MLYTILLGLLLIDSVILVAAILMQSGKGGGLAASFGGATTAADALIGTRQAGNLLTKATWWCGGIFLALSFVLQIASTRGRVPRSVLEKGFANPVPTAPAPVTGGQTPPTTAVPLEPAPVTPEAPPTKTPPTKTP